jgi:hypothetical protein
VRDLSAERFVEVKIVMPVHLHRIDDACADKVVGIAAATAEREVRLRGIDAPSKEELDLKLNEELLGKP